MLALIMKETILFIHGWPDDSSVWSKQLKHFEQFYNCVPVTLPGFGVTEDKKDFPELVKFLVEEIKKHQTPVTLIGHDWGAYLAYMVEQKHPDLIKAIVGLDLGGHVVPRKFQEVILLPAYQTWLAGAWLIRNFLPRLANGMSQTFAKIAGAPNIVRVEARMNYIYFFVIRNILSPKLHKNLLHKYHPKCPILFIYGEKKPMMFHSRKWEKMISSAKNSKVLCIPGSGHWFMIEQPELTNELIDNWMKLPKCQE